MFEALFKNRKSESFSLQYKFADTVQVVKDDIKYDCIGKRFIQHPQNLQELYHLY